MTDQPNPFRWLLLAGVWMLYAGFGLVITSLAPLAAMIVDDLDMTHGAMGSVMGAWQFVYIFSAVPCGMLLDRLGPPVSLTIGGLLIAASVLARGFATDYYQLMAAVMLFGLGGPIISAGAPKVVTSCFTGQSRGLAMGIYMTGPATGGIVSLTLTHSVLLPAFDTWRQVMMLWAGLVFAATLAWLVITAMPAARMLRSEDKGPSVPQTRMIAELIRQPAVLIVLLMSVGVFLYNHGLNNWMPELLRSSGMTINEASYWAALPTAVGLMGSLLIPRLATPERRFNILVALSVSAALASIMLHFSGNELSLFTGLFLQGLVRASLMTVLILTLVELPGIGERYAGVASGLFFSTAEVGGVLGPLSLGLLYDMTHGFDAGLHMLTAVAVLLMLGSLRLRSLARTQPG